MTKQFTKSDMKDGYGVKQRDGLWFTWNSVHGSVRDEDLLHEKFDACDIMIVVSTDGEVLFKRHNRQRPNTIIINGYEVPEPVREPLNDGEKYYSIDATEEGLIVKWIWNDDSIDSNLLSAGWVYRKKEDAALLVKTLTSFTAKGERQ